jgi:aldehyde dehydrogenase (NAD+)
VLDSREFYINGQWVQPAEVNDLEVIDPSTEQVCAVISLGTQADTDAAVSAAQAAFDDWSMSPKEQRISLLERILEIYNKRSEDIAQAISLEMGAPIDMARTQQVGAGASHIKGFIRTLKGFEFDRMLGPHAPTDRILYEPVGVCALITPWNWPMNQITLKVMPALAAGCTMVLKPSEIAPLSARIFAEILHDAETPPGVFNMLNGDGLGVGTQLSQHPGVDMISFTGSSRAGAEISRNAAPSHKRVHLELGGKGANIIFSDAGEKAAKRGVLQCFNNSGQSCISPSRMLVQREIYDECVATAASVAKQFQVDLASKEGRHGGPVVSRAQYDKIQRYIQSGIDEGARLVAGGTGLAPGVESGYFVKPTVFADVSNDMTIAQEEIFGPVLSIIPFDSEEDAIRIANDTPYGLANFIHSEDGDKRNRVARRLRSGMVEMNGQSRGAGSPFGGMKASGNGREGGVWGLEEFLEVKSVTGWNI